MLARSKLNSIESKIPEALINNEISHEDLVTIINEEKKYRELRESIRMIIVKGVMQKKLTQLEKIKKIDVINEVIHRNKIIDNTLKP